MNALSLNVPNSPKGNRSRSKQDIYEDPNNKR